MKNFISAAPLNFLGLYQGLYMALARAVLARALKTTGSC